MSKKELKELGNIDEGIDKTNLILIINTVATVIGSVGSLIVSLYILLNK